MCAKCNMVYVNGMIDESGADQEQKKITRYIRGAVPSASNLANAKGLMKPARRTACHKCQQLIAPPTD